MRGKKIVKKKDDFKQIKTKIFMHTMESAFIAIGIICLGVFLLQGKFGDWMVGVNRKWFRLDYDAAKTLYQWTFRNHLDLMFVIGVIIIFSIVFYSYLNQLTKYFLEINKGIDDLINESAEEVSLSPELSVIEKKINTIKHTLEKQKIDMKLAEQRKSDMLMYLAHDLKTPLASVIGYLNLLCDEEQISEELRQKYLSVSLKKAERLEELINEFFEIAKLNLINVPLKYSIISLSRMFEMVLYEFQPMLQEKDMKCVPWIPGDIILKCDANKIQRVFDNLLKNAIVYGDEGTDIDVDAYTNGNNVIITFLNCTDIIPKDNLERIFEQFYRLDDSRDAQKGGAGLGLAIAKQIVELHNGTITVKSEPHTIEFQVTLPMFVDKS